MPRLAQEVEAGLLPEVTGLDCSPGRRRSGLDPSDPRRQAAVASVRVKGEGTCVVSVQSGVFPADSAARGEALAQPLAGRPLRASSADREILGMGEEVAGEKVDLTKADYHRGRSAATFSGANKMAPIEALAKALGAEIAASRPVIDNGWLPRDRQIGSFGPDRSPPSLYIAAGISGAIQHLVGMKGPPRRSWRSTRTPAPPSSPWPTTASSATSTEMLPALTEAMRAAKG